ncbi:hypothetical protein [Streptomyces sp. NPDC093094]|uniref:hypothetical protein n=1 Tax=Streptomyces sp. NPDC093094 TaxID=3366026 RepID=UPI0038254855
MTTSTQRLLGMAAAPATDGEELLPLVPAEWEPTLVALVCTEITEAAARRGVSLLPEE